MVRIREIMTYSQLLMNRRSPQLKAKAKTCLMVTEQVKHEEKFYIALDQETSQVTLLIRGKMLCWRFAMVKMMKILYSEF